MGIPADVKQGDIYWVEIFKDETRGSEQYKRRPYIIVSRTAINKHHGEIKVCVAKTDQARVIDKSRLEDRMGYLSQTASAAVGLGLSYLFNL